MDDQTKVDDQDAINHRTADTRGWTIPSGHVYKDNSRSAWKRNRKRPGWDAMLAAIKAGELDAIIVYHGDRLIRQPWDLELLINLADQKGIRIASPTGDRDLDNADDRFILRIEAAQACRESDNISRRTKNGHRRKREQGYVRAGGRGGRAYGFETDGVTLIPAEVNVTREAAQRVLAAEKTGAIMRDLNARGFRTPTGGPFSHGGLKKMLLRPRYAGLMPDGESPAAWPPVYDDDRGRAREIWEGLVAILGEKAAEFAYATNARRYLLTNIAACGSCGETVAIRHSTKSESLRGYGCINPDCTLKVHRKVTHVDAWVVGHVLRILSDNVFLNALQHPQDAGVGNRINALVARKAEVEAQLAMLADHPTLKPELLIAAIESFDRRIQEARAGLAKSARARLLISHAGISEDAWESLPLDRRRALLAACVKVTILPTSKRGPGFNSDDVLVEPVTEV